MKKLTAIVMSTTTVPMKEKEEDLDDGEDVHEVDGIDADEDFYNKK